ALSWPQEHPAHRPLHRAFTRQVPRLLARLAWIGPRRPHRGSELARFGRISNELGCACGRYDPPVGGTFGFRKLLMPPLTKTCPKMVLSHKGGSLCVKDVFAKKLFGA